MEKKIYLNDLHTSKIISIWIFGIVPNKAYVVLDEKIKIYKSLVLNDIRKDIKYKIRDDYGNVRWIDSCYFYDIEQWRNERISRILK